MKAPKLTFLILLVFISFKFSFTQNQASISGLVSNALTSAPIEGALVELGIYSATTGDDGYYFIGDIVPGTYDLFCVSAGFCPFDTTLTFEPSQNLTLNIALDYALLELSADTLEISLYPYSSGVLYFDLSNPGPCNNTYYASADVDWLGGSTTITGSVFEGQSVSLGWLISSYALDPGWYEGNIIIYSFAISSPDSIHVILEVLGYSPPTNLTGYVDCTDICLNWDPPATGTPLYYNIYRDGNLIANFSGIEFCEQNLYPQAEYCYQVTAVYESGESEPTDELCITVPMPENLEPQNAHCTHYYNANWIFWDEAEGCLEPEGYNVYRDGELLTNEPIPDLMYTDPIAEPNIFEYEVSAVYFFGESELMLADCLTGIHELENQSISIFPNPARNWVVIRSPKIMVQIEIFNNLGEKVYSVLDANKETAINLTGNKPGIYFIRIETNEAVFTRKIVRQR